MLRILRLTLSPLLSLFILILGNGLFNTLLIVRLHNLNESSLMIGAMTGVYYAGLALGSFRIERFIIRVGHIRAFSAFASAVAVISILHGIFVIPWLWLIFRLIGGFATAGLFIVIESWLLVLGTIKTRGQVLALYMITLYAAQALGQFLINLSNPDNLLLFTVTAMLSSLAVIPLAMTKVTSPEFGEPSSLSFKMLYKASGAGVIGCFTAGLTLGAIYGLLPLFVAQKLNITSDIALFTAVTIFGGMTLQYPIGKLSDRIERRTVLIMLTALIFLVSIAIIFTFQHYWLAIVLIFLFGGFTFTLYPISITQTCDNLAPKDIVSGTQGLLLAYSIGAMLGPIIAPLFMHGFGTNGLFIYFMLTSGLLGFFLIWRRLSIKPRPREEQFIFLPQTTPITAELDPRSEESSSGEK